MKEQILTIKRVFFKAKIVEIAFEEVKESLWCKSNVLNKALEDANLSDIVCNHGYVGRKTKWVLGDDWEFDSFLPTPESYTNPLKIMLHDSKFMQSFVKWEDSGKKEFERTFLKMVKQIADFYNAPQPLIQGKDGIVIATLSDMMLAINESNKEVFLKDLCGFLTSVSAMKSNLPTNAATLTTTHYDWNESGDNSLKVNNCGVVDLWKYKKLSTQSLLFLDRISLHLESVKKDGRYETFGSALRTMGIVPYTTRDGVDEPVHIHSDSDDTIVERIMEYHKVNELVVPKVTRVLNIEQAAIIELLAQYMNTFPSERLSAVLYQKDILICEEDTMNLRDISKDSDNEILSRIVKIKNLNFESYE